MEKSTSFAHGYQSGCESTLNQILRLLSQDESIIRLNTEDRNTLISRIIDGSDENANNTSNSVENRPYLRSQSSHVQRLQETEINMGWNLTDDEEDSPLLTLQNNRNGRLTRYSTFAANKRKVSRESISTKKNVQQWLKLQAIYTRIKDCAEDEDEDRMELCIRKF